MSHEVVGANMSNPTAQRVYDERIEVAPEPDQLLVKVRDCLKRWAARYARSEHAQRHVKETRLLVQELERQLDAEREGYKLLVDALEQIRQCKSLGTWGDKVISDALAKVT